jgi:hypothetical protein
VIAVTSATVAAGGSVSVALEFINPSNGAIAYTTRVLAGAGTP